MMILLFEFTQNIDVALSALYGINGFIKYTNLLK